jgi:hypothetical protein
MKTHSERNLLRAMLRYISNYSVFIYFSRITLQDTWKCTSDVARNGNILVMYVVKYSAIYSPYKPINTMSIKLAVGNVRRRRPGEQKGKELMNQVCINENISITNFVFTQIFFSFKNLQDLRHALTKVREYILCNNLS